MYISRVLSAQLTSATFDEPKGRVKSWLTTAQCFVQFAHCIVINNTMLHNATLALKYNEQWLSDMVHNEQKRRVSEQ
eukprot:5360865-Amphidinium_carterae.1